MLVESRVVQLTRLVVDTTDVETLIASEESYTLSVKSPVLHEFAQPTISLDSDWGNGCALLDSSGGGGNNGRKNGGNGSSLHRAGLKKLRIFVVALSWSGGNQLV
jgi:hypothetical protein